MSEKIWMSYRFWVVQNFSSHRGLLRTVWHQLLFSLGRHRQYKNIDWSSVERLVFVCKGNICRSAYAEQITRSMGYPSISFGVDTRGDDPADADAIKMADQHGFDLSQHKTQPVMNITLNTSDLLVAMEPWHIDVLKEKFGSKYQYSLLGLWARPVLPHLQDPYGADATYFDKCFSYIENAVKTLVSQVHQ